MLMIMMEPFAGWQKRYLRTALLKQSINFTIKTRPVLFAVIKSFWCNKNIKAVDDIHTDDNKYETDQGTHPLKKARNSTK